MSVRRFDKATFTRAVKLDNGMLRAPARLTRVGVFEYATADGKIVKELRLPEEVFSEDSIASFELVPLTDDHPTVNGGHVTAENAKELAVGSIGQPKPEGNFLVATLMVTDAKAIKKITGGKQELSCGYFCDREPAPAGAVWTDSAGKKHPYDFIQRNIRGNHVAIVTRGRAGPEVRLQLDSEDAVQTEGENLPKPTEIMEKITIDGLDFEVAPTVKQAIEKLSKTNEAAVSAAKAEADKNAARADAADAKVKEMSEELKKALDPAIISAAVAARVALETKARAFLTAEVKLDSLDESGIKKAVVSKLSPEIKLDGKSAEYVNALFDVLTVTATKENPATKKVAEEVKTTPAVTKDSATDAREKYLAAFFGNK